MRYSRLGYWGFPAAALILLVLASLFVLNPPILPLSGLKVGVFAAAAVVCIALSLMAYRYADDVILQTHKTAWFWGSMIAVAALAPVMVILSWHVVDLNLPMPRNPAHHVLDPQFYLVQGMALMFVAQGIGFSAFAAWMRWRR